ncbi:unnamed protein product [Ilex paraguariensis]|uniref:Uncharacterized protein n=1 Tax=Ilex paraguariensis TaxID=185542 RepID=A0ABC8UMT3_9AQUA
MSTPPGLKKPKMEREEESNGEADNENGEEKLMWEEREEALVALIEHRTKEVEHLRQRLSYYKSQLDQAERRLEETHVKLARHRGRDKVMSSKGSVGNGMKEVNAEQRSTSPTQISEGHSQRPPQSRPQLVQENVKPSKNSLKEGVKEVKLERRSSSPIQISEDSSKSHPPSKPRLVIPAVNPKVSPPTKMAEFGSKINTGSSSRTCASVPTHTDSIVKQKGDKFQRISSEQEAVETQAKGTKRKAEQKEHKDIIPLIHSSSSPRPIRCQTGCLISSQHKRKLRSLVLCPTNDQLFVTSSLDGVVNLWQVQARGSNASLLSTTDCVSLKHRRWPEDIAWHPQGNYLYSVYSADGGDSQISILNLNKTKEGTRVSYIEEKPHVKGIINNIMFMPWDDICFVTGGSDHAVVLWTERDGENSWKPKALHRNMHSSAVMGVAGMLQKQIVMSVGADKRIIGYDLLAGRADYKHQIESKCMSILPNPRDFNLFMVQTGTLERQLRLFDIRVRQTEVHAFGWKQESSDSQSALINQAWSPDGLYITSGSVDPVIHIFDIRYNAHKPSQSIKAHQKRVFKAVWHYALPLMISISSDLNIGLHKII